MNVEAFEGWLVGLVAGLGALGWLVTKAWRGFRKMGHFIDDVSGEPARPGTPARPSLMDRLAAVEDAVARIPVVESSVAQVRAEVTPNGGGSLKDAVVRIEAVIREHDQLLRDERRDRR